MDRAVRSLACSAGDVGVRVMEEIKDVAVCTLTILLRIQEVSDLNRGQQIASQLFCHCP